ncbi:dynactin 150 kDa subunit [Heterostelium album PN500]|uniref:Dynactin 150 kDa subunit n=1 Tax=Heterostelium pallidum (strain ATCC 26659 / Pp 5 / PN500) TaxID=670386 RepID=D3AX75_HETP5|nr:dynactin 150 kDa subunit [Heterostelium album PN500]EFA86144.1 dynactin 150 kDa subunit [Heterostelium album PN500]|eukprot:XP_020438249.1 dynactin 150 kDa subunit [Heterostelium album PN500]
MEEGKAIQVGTRVTISGKPEFGEGTVRYVGMTKFNSGRWVGIELDQPVGKNDGSVQGVKYFDCKAPHGIFVKINVVVPSPNSVAPATATTSAVEVDDSKLMPPPPSPSTTTTTTAAPSSGLRAPASSGIRPPSSTGIRPPSSLGKRPSITPTSAAKPSAATTSTPSASTTTTSGISKPSSTLKKSVDETATSTPTTTTTAAATEEATPTPAVTTPTPTPTPAPVTTTSGSGLRRPSESGLKKPSTTATPSTTTPTTSKLSAPSRLSLKPSSSSSTTTTKSTTSSTTSPAAATTTTTTSAAPPTQTTTSPEPEPVAAPEVTDVDISSVNESPRVPATTATTAEVDTTTTTTTSTTSTSVPAVTSPTIDRKSKVVAGEDDDEEEEDDEEDVVIKEIMAKKAQPTMQMNENLEKMLTAINELTEYKTKAQAQIADLQVSVKEVTSSKDKVIKDLERQIQQLEKSIKEKEKESEHAAKSQQKLDESIEKHLSKEKNEWEKEKQDLLDQINSLNENIEMLTLDKEFAEEKAEVAETELEMLKEEMELLKSTVEAEQLEREQAAESAGNDDSGESAAVLRAQNEKLKETLVKLRDVAVNEKHEFSKKTKELESSTKQVAQLLDKVSKLETEVAAKKSENEELREALEDASTSESLVTDLSEKNMELSEKVEELTTMVADLEDMRDLSAELEENQAAVEKALRSDIHQHEIENLNLNGQLANLRLKLQENDSTITQFRSLVSKLQSKIEEMRRAEEKHAEQNSLWAMVQQELLSKNIQLQNQVTKATAMEIDHQLEKYRSKEAELHLSYVSEFLPEQSFSADNDSIKMLLLLKRIVLKCQLAQRYLNRTYKVEEIGMEKEGETTLTADDVSHSLQIIHILDHLSISANWLIETLQRCPVEQWLRAGRSARDMEYQERVLDQLLNLIKQEQYGSSYASADLEKMTAKIDAILANVFGNSIYKSEWSILLNLILNIQYNIKQIMLNDLNVCTMATHAGRKYYFPQQTLSKALSMCRKVVKNLMLQPLLRQSSIVRDVLTSSESTCNGLLVLLVEGAPRVRDDSAYFDSLVAGIDTKAEMLAASAKSAAADSGMDDDDQLDSSLSALEQVFARMSSQMKDVVETILAGDLELSDHEKSEFLAAAHPWVTRAQQLKLSLGEAGTLRDNISNKEHELLENLKMIKTRDAELLEEKRKEEALNKRIKTLLKNETDLTESLAKEQQSRSENENTYRQAINRLQKDKSVLEQDYKSLQTRYVALEREQTKKSTATPALEQRVDNIDTASFRKAIKHLRSENTRLKSQKSMQQLQELNQPFKLFNVNNIQLDNSNNNNNNDAAAAELSVASNKSTVVSNKPRFNEIIDFNKELDCAIGELVESMVTPKVLDITASKSAITAAEGSVLADNGRRQMIQKRLQLKQLENKFNHFVHSSMTSVPGTIQSQHQFGRFTDIASIKVRKEVKPTLIGSVTIPQTTSSPVTTNSIRHSSLQDPEIMKALNNTDLPFTTQLDSLTSFKKLHMTFVN